MKPQNITTRANANHFDHPENNSVKSASPKNQSGAPAKPALSNTPENLSSNPQVNLKKTETTPKTNATAEAHPVTALHEPTNETVFRLDAPTAHAVWLAGDFSDWEKSPIKMIKGGGGVWHAKVLLARGRHQFRFVVDGEWQNDPHYQAQVHNSFGSFNHVVEVH